MRERLLKIEVVDVVFTTTKYGNIKPELVIQFNSYKGTIELPNVHVLLESGVMIGDYIKAVHDIESQLPMDVDKGIDRSPPLLPTHCPCCGEELSIQVGRHTVLKCLNVVGCSAQNQ